METLGTEVNYILPEVPHKTKSKRSPENMTRSIIVSLGQVTFLIIILLDVILVTPIYLWFALRLNSPHCIVFYSVDRPFPLLHVAWSRHKNSHCNCMNELRFLIHVEICNRLARHYLCNFPYKYCLVIANSSTYMHNRHYTANLLCLRVFQT